MTQTPYLYARPTAELKDAHNSGKLQSSPPSVELSHEKNDYAQLRKKQDFAGYRSDT